MTENADRLAIERHIRRHYHYEGMDALDAVDITLLSDSRPNGSPLFAARAYFDRAQIEDGDYLIEASGPDGMTSEIVRIVDGEVITVWANC